MQRTAVAAGGPSIAVGDVPNLIAAVGAAYRPNAAFVMSEAMQRSVSLLVDSAERPVYRHILDGQPTLQNYPVHIIKAASSTDIQFGDFSYLYAKSTSVELRVDS